MWLCRKTGYLGAMRTFWAICCSALRKATSGHITRRAAGINQGQVAPLLAQRRTVPGKADPTGPEGGVEQGHLLLPSHPQVLVRQRPATNSNPIPSRKKERRDLRQTQTESPGREKKKFQQRALASLRFTVQEKWALPRPCSKAVPLALREA